MCNPRPGWVNGAIIVVSVTPYWEIIFDILIIHSILPPKCQVAQLSICIRCDICFRNLRVNDLSAHGADHSYLTYQIKMATDFPILGICNYLSILPKIMTFQFQYSVKVVSADGPVLQCHGICCHYSDLSFLLIWWLWFLGSYASVAVFTFADCSLKRLWFFKGCLWDGCLRCLKYIMGNLVWYLFLTYSLIDMFSVSIHKKVCALV